MKFVIDRREFADSLKWVTSALAKHPPTPAMNGVRVTVTDDAIELTAWDYTAAHTARLPLVGAEPGEALIPGGSLSYLVGALRTKEVTIAVSDDVAEVTGGAATYRLRLLPLGDFTAPPKPPKQIGSVSGAALAEAVGAVAWAAPGDDDPLAGLIQIHMEVADGLLHLVATNRFLFGVDAITYNGKSFDVGVNPGMLASAVSGLADDAEVGIGLDGSMLALIGADRTVALRLVDAPFLAWRKVASAELPETCRVEAGDVAEAVKRVGSLAGEKDAAVMVEIESDAVVVTAHSETGDGTESVAAEASAPTALSFTPSYLAACLKAIGGAVEIAYKPGGASSPVRVATPTLPHRIALTQSRRIK